LGDLFARLYRALDGAVARFLRAQQALLQLIEFLPGEPTVGHGADCATGQRSHADLDQLKYLHVTPPVIVLLAATLATACAPRRELASLEHF
jgi:hypothetical protein